MVCGLKLNLDLTPVLPRLPLPAPVEQESKYFCKSYVVCGSSYNFKISLSRRSFSFSSILLLSSSFSFNKIPSSRCLSRSSRCNNSVSRCCILYSFKTMRCRHFSDSVLALMSTFNTCLILGIVINSSMLALLS